MNIDKDTTAGFVTYWLDDMYPDLFTILGDGLLRLFNTGVVKLNGSLRIHQYLSGISRTQLFYGLSGAGIQRFQETSYL